MSTAPSWTEPRTWRDPLVDLGALVRFRLAAVRGRTRRRLAWVATIPFVLTVLAALAPAYVDGAGATTGRAADVLDVLGPALTSFLALTVVSSVASGGGRELVSREQGVPFPVSPVCDHLGALLMAPLNIAWLVQGWVLLGFTAFAVGADRVWLAQPLVLLWLAVATAAGQVVGWTMEAVRRGPHGVLVFRAVSVGAGLVLAALVLADRLRPLLDASPANALVTAARDGAAGPWLLTLVLLGVGVLALVLAGAWPAAVASRRLPRDEARLESTTHAARPNPTSDAVALARVDLASIVRSVPLRRGMVTLSLLPGIVALAGGLGWTTLILMPGLVASGAGLLFGVNAWCLDARGALWRESLPVGAATAFRVRAGVLTGLLLACSSVTLVLGALRAGTPTAGEAAAVLSAWLVVCVQVVAACLHWSVRNPFPVDLRSARATPAPPSVMVGYSGRLALVTTLVGMLFSGLSVLPWWVSPVVAALFVAWSLRRLARAHRAWEDPQVRSRVVVTVAA